MFVISIVLTFGIRYYANRKNILDIPNDRSSHMAPVPTGGGLSIIITFYLGLIYFKESVNTALFFALLSGIPIALVSIIDDMVTLSSKVRLLVQSGSTILALYALGGVKTIDFIFIQLDGAWLNILAFFTIMWLTNLYNFLDGIDGYAASQAIIIGLGIYIFFSNPLGLVIVAGCAGFLFFNWHKASIFMGDVGSATLGFIFAVFVFYDTGNGNIYIWLVLLGLFWFDATLTLVRRYQNSELLTQAHKKHAYQRLTQIGWSHSKVVVYASIVNICFLALLYFTDEYWKVFILNVVTLFAIMKFVDMKKGFKSC